MTRNVNCRLVAAGAISGGIWFLVALAFDKGVRDFNYPVIATNSAFAALGSLLAAIATGVGVALAFRAVWVTRSYVLLCAAPFMALATGIVAYSLLTWMVWLVLGDASGVARLHRLADIVSFFVLYGLISMFAPFLYVLALLNQLAIRGIVRRAT